MSLVLIRQSVLTLCALCVVLSLSACESLNPLRWFESEEPQSPYAGQEVPGSDQDYPSVSSVPERPAEGLIADTRDRLYEDEAEQQNQEETALSGAPPPEFMPPPREPTPAPVQSVTAAGTMPPPATAQGLESPDMAPPPLALESSDMVGLLDPAPPALIDHAAVIESTAPERRLVSMKMGTLVFPFGSSAISPNDRGHIKKVVDIANQKNALLRVVGHASSFTNDMSLMDHQIANFSISWERAQAIAALILASGFDHERLLIRALSDSDPVFPEVMPAGQRGNQRAEIYMEY